MVTNRWRCIENPRVGEGAIWIGQGILVMYPAAIERMPLIDDPVKPDQVRVKIQRIARSKKLDCCWEDQRRGN